MNSTLLIGRVSVVLHLLVRVNIIQLEIVLEAMRAPDHELFVSLCSLGHLSYAKAAYVVLAAA